MSGRGASAILALILWAAASSAAPGEEPAPTAAIALSSRRPFQGDPVFVTAVPDPPAEAVSFLWKGLTVPARDTGGGRFRGVVGVDLLEPPGPLRLEVLATRSGETRRLAVDLTVVEKGFPTQELRVAREMAEFDAATLARIREERIRMDGILSRLSAAPAWDDPFVAPVAGFRPAGFGSRRVINGEPRSPHAGVDFQAPEGTPVVAAAFGTVAFAGEQFFGGKSVVIDHGGGLFTIYYHLRDVAAAEGRTVAAGERIGSVGSTGRASGPHLHFGVRAPGGRVDPAAFFGTGGH